MFDTVFAALGKSDVRFVVVGGVAIVLQGHARMTADLDVVIDLAPDEALRAIEVLLEIGLQPRLPVDARDFADVNIRNQWIAERSLTVFSMYDASNPLIEVDLFVDPPISFEDLWNRSDESVVSGQPIRVASVDDLIEMKRLVGRPQDLADIAALEEIRELRKTNE